MRRTRGGLVNGVIKHRERVDASVDDILQGVVRTKGASCMVLGLSQEQVSPTILTSEAKGKNPLIET